MRYFPRRSVVFFAHVLLFPCLCLLHFFAFAQKSVSLLSLQSKETFKNKHHQSVI